MTVQKALDYLKNNEEKKTAGIYIHVKFTAINALEKQIPKPLKNLEYACDIYGNCPTCGKEYVFSNTGDFNYCPNCGQAILWPEKGLTAKEGAMFGEAFAAGFAAGIKEGLKNGNDL